MTDPSVAFNWRILFNLTRCSISHSNDLRSVANEREGEKSKQINFTERKNGRREIEGGGERSLLAM